jgi:hypothetical protein
MKIKMLKVSADSSGVKIDGSVYEVDNNVGKALIEAGSAIKVEESEESVIEETIEETKVAKSKKK